MSAIRMSAEMFHRVRDHLYSTPGEHFAFFLATWGEDESGPVFLVKDAILVQDEQAVGGPFEYEVSLEAILEVVNKAVLGRFALIEVHNHGGQHPRFSRTDRQQMPRFTEYVHRSLPDRPYAATVWGDEMVYGEWFRADGSSGVVRSITTIGDRLTSVVSRDDDEAPVPERFSRQVPWFTRAGQLQISRLRIAVVGAGGTGSLVVQYLSYLGVRDFVIIESDFAENTNMNRLVTAGHADIGISKGILARSLVERVAPETAVCLETDGVPSPKSIRLLAGADIIFGCVDDDGPRHVLNAVARAYCIPYLDVATGISVDPERALLAGGRLVMVLPGGPCVHCMHELDLEELRHWLRPPSERTFAEERGYVRGMNVPAPSVISLNASLAAAAVNEFAVYVSGVRPVVPYSDYDLIGAARSQGGQWLTPREVQRNPNCLECANEGIAGRADLDRFWRRRR